MDKFSRLTPDQRADLVAYLDGELDEHATTDIETVLSHSAIARNDVEMLARTYDLLDELPRSKASPDFTDRTLKTIHLDRVRPDITQTEWFRKARRGSVLLAWSLAMVGAAALGCLVTQRLIPNQSDVLVRDYEVIKDLDVYSEVGSFEFLERLQADPYLKDELKSRRQP